MPTATSLRSSPTRGRTTARCLMAEPFRGSRSSREHDSSFRKAKYASARSPIQPTTPSSSLDRGSMFSVTSQHQVFEMKILLVLIMADGPKQTAIEVETLSECWERAMSVISRADLPKMQEAGVTGVGTGCIVIPDPTQETLRDGR